MRLAVALASVVACAGCRRGDGAGATPEAAVSTSAAPLAITASASAAVAVTSAAPPPPTAPLELEVGPALEGAWTVARVEGALVVASGSRVARLTRGPDGAPKLAWSEAKAPVHPTYGQTSIDAVYGRWPDALDVVVSNDFGRVPEPTMVAFTGKGSRITAAPGGGIGWILGSARVGGSTLTGSFTTWQGVVYESFRGPPLARAPARFDASCKPEDFPLQPPSALFPAALAATEAGTMIAVGSLCKWDGKPTAEVWDAKGASRLVDLSRWTRSASDVRLIPGRGDELLALVGGVLLRWRDGAFDAIPGPGKPIQNLFTSKDGVVHVNAGGALHRRDGDGWKTIGTLPFTTRFRAIELDDDGGLWVSAEGVRPLRPGGIAFRPGCATPFVHLSDVSDRAPPRYGFPASRKVLDEFSRARVPGTALDALEGGLALVEFTELGQRRLGVVPKDEAQGRRLVEHWRQRVKEDEPRLLCFKPSNGREIERR